MSSEPATIREWLRDRPTSNTWQRLTLAETGRRVCDGEALEYAVAEFLDEVNRTFAAADMAGLVDEQPPALEDRRQYAFLAALAEHLAAVHGFAAPAWATAPDTFLETYWFVSRYPGFHARAIVESPAAFRRRGIFINASMLMRV
jgi:hypothetical protein